ncbi:hypothetical protein CHCC14820_1310 [Bacillus paralicheniformis]|uniref:Uncharacterized protein n=1 Tax=Bacillus paralicheniformis TaxID=1648923 RepID=A0ABY3FZR2_9BACI|nr:hypothetical protein SC10_B2orf03143 [Bacillus paralicheniformis]OLG07467.1 hypothetical protein B4125_1648 [Bacillus paralicheniformis]TWJ56017.1 hypothetical protein CHCC5022_1145 [Bacillus paralicheniformis]TWJ78360.1 hypothetical protein CHCC4186_2373 [Bacillus paralicheniformis]TWK83898.1 hypothetical protein CHCC20331_0310 [Bacillus paralicheniformis]
MEWNRKELSWVPLIAGEIFALVHFETGGFKREDALWSKFLNGA